MFRVWGKIVIDNRVLKDMVVIRPEEDTRTHKIFHALAEICNAFDLPEPIWLDANVAEFKYHKKTRFSQNCFVESIAFDFLEFSILDED